MKSLKVLFLILFSFNYTFGMADDVVRCGGKALVFDPATKQYESERVSEFGRGGVKLTAQNFLNSQGSLSSTKSVEFSAFPKGGNIQEDRLFSATILMHIQIKGAEENQIKLAGTEPYSSRDRSTTYNFTASFHEAMGPVANTSEVLIFPNVKLKNGKILEKIEMRCQYVHTSRMRSSP